MYVKECDKALSKIDYNLLLDAIINDYGYDDFIRSKNDRANLLMIPKYKDMDDKITKILQKLINHNKLIRTWEQDKTFKHIAINREFEPGNNKFRLYLSPNDDNIYYLIFELIKRCTENNMDIYFKYDITNRVDKIVIYLKNKNDLDSKIKLFESIKSDYPTLFENMDRSIACISKTKVEGVYMAPEKIIKRKNGTDFKSYTQVFVSAISDMKYLLLYKLGNVNIDGETLKKYDRGELLELLKPIASLILGKYGILMYEKNNNLKVYYNEKFPGVGQPLNEDISVDSRNNCLEYGIRLNGNIFRYFILPAKDHNKQIEDLSKYTFYDMDIQEHIRKKLYN